MKTNRLIKLIMLPIFFATAAGLSFAGDPKAHHDEIVAWKDVPALVQATITAEAKGGKIGRVERETEDKGVTYEAKVKLTDGTELEIKTDAAGKLIEVKKEQEEDDDDRSAPKGKEDHGHKKS